MSAQDSTPRDPDARALLFARLCVAAGAIAMEVFARRAIEARVKNDSSPVTEADERIEAFLLAELSRRLPGLPLIAEERAARGETPAQTGAFLLIDPLDGTREFLARRPEFTVNIALIENGAPRAGAVYAPALGELWFAARRPFSSRPRRASPCPRAKTGFPCIPARAPTMA